MSDDSTATHFRRSVSIPSIAARLEHLTQAAQAATADLERARAEQDLLDLMTPAQARRIAKTVRAMSDDELRAALREARQRARRAQAEARAPALRRATLSTLAGRVLGWACGLAGGEDLLDLLRESLDSSDLDIADDGLVEISRLTPTLEAALGQDLAIAMYHHTATGLFDSIRAEGLRIGRPTNFFNSQAGVYVSTMRAGRPVAMYGQRAALVHGGEPTAIRVRRTLGQIQPDPDDHDLAWAQGRQFVTPSVPVEDLCDADLWEGHADPRLDRSSMDRMAGG